VRGSGFPPSPRHGCGARLSRCRLVFLLSPSRDRQEHRGLPAIVAAELASAGRTQAVQVSICGAGTLRRRCRLPLRWPSPAGVGLPSEGWPGCRRALASWPVSGLRRIRTSRTGLDRLSPPFAGDDEIHPPRAAPTAHSAGAGHGDGPAGAEGAAHRRRLTLSGTAVIAPIVWCRGHGAGPPSMRAVRPMPGQKCGAVDRNECPRR
jgi:hypothetical protein